MDITESDTLCIECGFSKIAVVCLVVCPQIGITVSLAQTPTHFEVADEGTGIGEGIVTISEITIYEQSVVEESARQTSLDIEVVPPLFASYDTGSEVPVGVVADEVADDVVELSGEG